MKPETCPDRQTLEKLLLGDLPATERESLAEHLLHCDECVGAAETITVGDDLTEALRARHVMASDQSAIQEVIDRAKQLRATSETLEVDETIVARALPQSAEIESPSHEEDITFLAPAEQPDELGRLGGYRVLEVLGVGGMGIVFRAEDPQLKRQVALKAMKPAVATSRSAKDRFLREARATAAIEHDNIVHIYQVGEDQGVPFIAMQFLRGESLQDRLARESRLRPAEVVKIGREMADGLEAAHRQDLVHRDIKPDNIWLEEGSGRVKIVDFGLVRSADSDAGLTQAGTVMGTPRYMAPEQAQGQVVDHRCDLFSLGSVLYRAATGKAPFEGSNITATLIAVAQAAPKPVAEVDKEIDPDLAALIMRLLSKDRDARPQTAAEVSQQLADIGQKIDTRDGVSSPGPTDTLAATGSFPIRPVAEKLPTIVKQPARLTAPRPNKKASVSGGNNRTKLIAAGLGGALVLVAAIVFFVRIGKYDVQITLADPSVALQIDGQTVVLNGDGSPIRLKAGSHMLAVEREGLETETKEFTVKKDGKTTVHVRVIEGRFAILENGAEAPQLSSAAGDDSPTELPRAVPPLAIAPFDAKQARAHQEAWAKHLGTTVETTNSVGAKMVLIPPGEFLMGSSDEQVEAALKVADEINAGQPTKDRIQNAERPQHKVVLTKPFLMGATEVTIGQFKKFSAAGYQTEGEKQAIATKTASPPKASAPSQPPVAPPQPVKTYLNPGYSVTDDSPAAQITWNDAVAYCRWLTAQEKVIYRLPTEAEWEFACRAGTTTQYSFGDDAAFLDLYGWYIKNQSGNSQPVGTKLPNAFGLFDMHGNLFEWCQDFWNEKWYELSPTNDPTGSTYIVGWVMRGGCWNFSATHGRSAYRHTLAYRDLNVGFRVVRVLDVPAMTASVTPKYTLPASTSSKVTDISDAAFQQWMKDVAALPVKQQVEAVAKKLVERNPGFDGKVKPTIQNDYVTELRLSSETIADISPLAVWQKMPLTRLDISQTKVSDLSPIKDFKLTSFKCINTKVLSLSALQNMPLTELNCAQTLVSDFSPLKGMKLTVLTCYYTKVIDLTPLQGMPLTRLYSYGSPISDLSPLKGMKLVELDLMYQPVSDLSPLQGMPLTVLNCFMTKISDLSPLEGMPLINLACGRTKVSDLSPLQGMPLTILAISDLQISDLTLLREMKLTRLYCDGTPVSDLSPLKGMPLTGLRVAGTQVSDLSVIKAMPLVELFLDFKPERDTELLRSIKTLKKINDKPVAEFLKEVE
jgi:formylglycine-generating enzyme required for sulfatase activity/serine/threonine protein kinase/Leucine-rich repeat (LRR) protein